MSVQNSTPTQSYLHEILEYHQDTGIFTWKKSRGNQFTKIGMKAGYKDSSGHMGIEINRVRYLSHRLVWLYLYGHFPKNQIDHINGIRDDNRLCNLREATAQQNMWNKKISLNNKSGFKNIHWSKTMKKWCVQIKANKKFVYVGYFKDLELADLIAHEARDKYHGQFAKHK